MSLYNRISRPHLSQSENDRAWAHATLDRWKAGEDMDAETVESALRITGDLVGLDAAEFRPMFMAVAVKEAA
jgi:hypothetical protein